MNTSCISITLQIAQIEIVNWKYAQWKHINFVKIPIYHKKDFMLTWGCFLGISKKEYFTKLQLFFNSFYRSPGARKISWLFFNVL